MYQQAQREQADGTTPMTLTRGSTLGQHSHRTRSRMTTSGAEYSRRSSTPPRGSRQSTPRYVPQTPGQTPTSQASTPLEITISPTFIHPSRRCRAPGTPGALPEARSRASHQTSPAPPLFQTHLGPQTIVQTLGQANPSNCPGPSTRQPLLQVVLLIDSNSCMRSFRTAYVPHDSVLRMREGQLAARQDLGPL
jgi:hypothetical protein